MLELDGVKLERLRKAMAKGRLSRSQQRYFYGVANARYILRKIFRLIEEEAKQFDIDPLAHQALIQIYGSSDGCLRIKDVAERLDINPAFSSSLIKRLGAMGYIKTKSDKSDKRIQWVSTTRKGQDLLRQIDERVNVHVEYFLRNIEAVETEAAISILLFYVGASLRSA